MVTSIHRHSEWTTCIITKMLESNEKEVTNPLMKLHMKEIVFFVSFSFTTCCWECMIFERHSKGILSTPMCRFCFMFLIITFPSFHILITIFINKGKVHFTFLLRCLECYFKYSLLVWKFTNKIQTFCWYMYAGTYIWNVNILEN